MFIYSIKTVENIFFSFNRDGNILAFFCFHDSKDAEMYKQYQNIVVVIEIILNDTKKKKCHLTVFTRFSFL